MSSFFARNKAQVSQICEGDKYPTIGAALTAVSMCISSMRPTTDIILPSEASISNGLLEPCVRAARAGFMRVCALRTILLLWQWWWGCSHRRTHCEHCSRACLPRQTHITRDIRLRFFCDVSSGIRVYCVCM